MHGHSVRLVIVGLLATGLAAQGLSGRPWGPVLGLVLVAAALFAHRVRVRKGYPRFNHASWLLYGGGVLSLAMLLFVLG